MSDTPPTTISGTTSGAGDSGDSLDGRTHACIVTLDWDTLNYLYTFDSDLSVALRTVLGDRPQIHAKTKTTGDSWDTSDGRTVSTLPDGSTVGPVLSRDRPGGLYSCWCSRCNQAFSGNKGETLCMVCADIVENERLRQSTPDGSTVRPKVGGGGLAAELHADIYSVTNIFADEIIERWQAQAEADRARLTATCDDMTAALRKCVDQWQADRLAWTETVKRWSEKYTLMNNERIHERAELEKQIAELEADARQWSDLRTMIAIRLKMTDHALTAREVIDEIDHLAAILAGSGDAAPKSAQGTTPTGEETERDV